MGSLWTDPVENARLKPGGYRADRAPGAVWLEVLGRYPHLVEIPRLRDAPVPVDNGECVGSYQILARAERWPHRATIDASCLCTGISSGRGLTANWRVYPFRVRFQDHALTRFQEISSRRREAASAGLGRAACVRRRCDVRRRSFSPATAFTHPIAVVVLAVVAIAAEHESIRLCAGDRSSVASLVFIFAAVVCGPLAAVVVGAAGLLADLPRRDGDQPVSAVADLDIDPGHRVVRRPSA